MMREKGKNNMRKLLAVEFELRNLELNRHHTQ